MKKLSTIALLSLVLLSCTGKWEYKIVIVKAQESGKFQSNKFDVSNDSLNLYGKDGWELVDVFEKTETVHPNYGDDRYVAGLQPNVRTSEINLVFKRKK